MPRRVAVLIALVAVLLPVHRASAQVPGGPDVVEGCREGGGTFRLCRGFEQFFRTGAQFCRQTPAPEPECGRLDGKTVSPDAVDAFEDSWTAEALAHQRVLDETVPLKRALIPHTHNSYNSAAYTPTFSGMDHNQVYSVADQLRMGVRAIELDVHWAPSARGKPEHGGKAPILCHGEPVPAGVDTVHAGCTTERTLRDGLEEISDWLFANPDEVILLYLENALDGDPVAHAEAVDALDDVLGNRIYRPVESAGCQALPIDLAREDLRPAQVLTTGDCGPGGWTDRVFERGARWKEGSSGEGDDYPEAPGCGHRTAARDYEHNLIRTWEDSTWLSAMVNDRGSDVTPSEASSMARCGMNLVGFDQLRPDDGRLEALVWSWAPDEPSTDGFAYRGADGRFRSALDGTAQRHFVCSDAGTLAVTAATGAWNEGAATCAAESLGTFGVPRTGWDNLSLDSGGDEVWLGYRSVDGAWTPTAA